MDLLQIIAVASIADPEGASRALELYQETCVVAVGKEVTLRRETEITK